MSGRRQGAPLTATTVASRVKSALPKMMYGFGDVPEPLAASVDALYELVECFVAEAARAGVRARRRRAGMGARDAKRATRGLSHKPLVWAVRRDRRLHTRVLELLEADAVIQKSKQLRYD